MALPRAKILGVVTVPTGGWTWDIDLSNVAQYDTNLTDTIAAGDYFVSGDNQLEDLLRVLTLSIQTAIDGVGGAPFAGQDIIIDIHPTTHKVRFLFADFTGVQNDVRMNYTAWSTGLCTALGIDSSTDVAKTTEESPQFTADWQHGYGFYCDDDGQTKDLDVVDTPMAHIVQGVSIPGNVKTQYYGQRYTNELQLQFLERDKNSRTKVFSSGGGYGERLYYPYQHNQPLECWWHDTAKLGHRFKVYRDGFASALRASDRGVSTAAAVTTLTDAGKAWSVSPMQHQYRLILVENYRTANGNSANQMFSITSHTDTVLTVPFAHPSGYDVDGGLGGAAGGTYYILDQFHVNYVVDLKRMKAFEPRESAPALDLYDITIPLLRYVA